MLLASSSRLVYTCNLEIYKLLNTKKGHKVHEELSMHNNSFGVTRSFMVLQKCFVSLHVRLLCSTVLWMWRVCTVCVCVYWPSCPLSWLLIKRLLYAEKHSGGVCFDLLPIPSLYSFIARNPLPRSRSTLSCLSLAFCLFSLQSVLPTSPDGNSHWNAKQQKGLFPVVIWRC